MIFLFPYLKIPSFDHAVATFFRVIARTTAQFLCFANHSVAILFHSLSLSSLHFSPHMEERISAWKEWQRRRNEKQHLKVWKENIKSKENYDKTHTHKHTIFLTQPKWMVRRDARVSSFIMHTCVWVFCFFYFNSNSFCPVFATHAVFKWVFESIVLFATWACVFVCASRFSVFVPCFIFQMFDYILFEIALYF